MVLCDSEGEESPTTEHGSEGRASWPFSGGVFFGEIHWDSNFSWRIVLWHNLGPEDVSDLGWERLDSPGIAEFSLPVIVHTSWCFTCLWSRTLKFMKPSACFVRSKCPTAPTDSWNPWHVDYSAEFFFHCFENLIFLLAETNSIIIAIINWKGGAPVPCVCAANLWRQPSCFTLFSLVC